MSNKNRNNNNKSGRVDKGRKYNRRGNSTRNTDVDKSDTRLDNAGRDNDPNWYFLDANIANQASSFSFDQYIGIPTELEVSDASKNHATYRTPSILVAEVAPSPGDTSSLQNGINMAGLSTYTTLSSLNAKTTQYAPQDVTILILAMGEIISILEHVRRAFGVAFTYNQRNRNLPTRLLDAMGFEAKSFLANIAQHRLEFNSWITSLNRLPFLDSIAYLYKCADMYQSVYADSESAMAQIMIMKPSITWILDEAYNDNGSGLKSVETPSVTVDKDDTWPEWSNLINRMLSALMTSSTLNVIFSDILNYSQKRGAKLLYLDYLREDYVVVPTYNRNFSLQMHNSIAIGKPLENVPGTTHTPFNDVRCNVEQNIIEYQPAWGPTVTLSTPIVDMDVPNAELVDRIEATRYMAGLKHESGADDEAIYIPAFMPDHYVTQYNVYLNSVVPSVITNSVTALSNVEPPEPFANHFALVYMTQFDWNPLMHVLDPTHKSMNIVGDVNYFTTLDADWFKAVNDLTFQALFYLR